ncbi:DUF3574 domain-containing protein [Psychromonas aquimarina]|uniref:DUF3574 domain-containing protein n=1 Tax=Psychromonas aquimarina TaxID=444919 RepID=UPI000412B711|nr:DUF3574 domain-containing protein [Psychromonas aquimarina]
MKNSKLLIIMIFVLLPKPALADSAFSVQLYFGQSIPGGGSVSEMQWRHFMENTITASFAGFNVVDSTGFYKGKAEHSKIVTIVIDESELAKVVTVAQSYAEKFHQDSVMMIKQPIVQWDFIEPRKVVTAE